MKIRTLLGISAAILSVASHSFAASKPTAKPQAKTEQFIQQLADKYHLSTQKIKTILSHAKYVPSVISKITTPYEAKPYDVYIQHFLTQERIKQGADFWNKHQQTLALAEKKYGVDPSVIIAILGVETLYGQRKGTYSVLDALYTLSFFYPPRADFFSNELAQYLVMCHNQHISPYSVTGSYAGAFGMPQFMPSSYRAYGIDFSHNHHIDLMHNTNDVIMSVANYLAKAGWQAHQPIASHLQHVRPSQLQDYLSPTATPVASTAELAQHGIKLQQHVSASQYASVIALNGTKSKEYWVAYANLHSIMKYNPSLNYAMAVFQLSQAIRKQHARHTT